MKTFNRIAAQGDVMIIKVDEIPANREMTEVPAEGDHVIITHSETGHHHVMERDAATLMQCKDNELECFLTVHRDATELRHLRDHDTHEPISFKKGTYKVIRQREYTAEGFRKAQD